MRNVSRLATVVAATMFWVAITQDPVGAVSPITATNRPLPLSGQTNGEVHSGQLINVTANCKVAREAGPSLYLLLKSARDNSQTIEPSECYRPLAGQVAAQQSWTQSGNSACAATPVKTSTGKVAGTSMHGWGKAADLSFGGGGFGSAGYNYLKSVAGKYGWNHPGWAEPGGSACPEAWHWEYVGDGGTERGDPVVTGTIGLLPNAGANGYATITGLGALNTSGTFTSHGDATGLALNWVMVGSAATPDNGGYWMTGADGGVFSFGDAQFYGSTGSMKLNKPVVGMTPTPTGDGYWLVAADGGVFSFGDASFHGSTGSMKLNRPIVGMTSTPTGKGYWLVAADGGIFAFGDASFYGSTGSMPLNQPVAGMASTKDGGGYWLVGYDGGIFAFGDASFHGSSGGAPPLQPVTNITTTQSGNGYWITVANGDVINFGDAPHFAKN